MNKDKNYWEKFYKNYDNPKCSKFCNFIGCQIKRLEVKNILDCGSGNGRDSYALGLNYNVTGLDTSTYIPESTETCTFLCDDFCTHDKDPYQLIYSRFTFHSITNEQHKIFLESIKKKGTILCIECRSDKDERESKVHGEDHYRNYINIEYLRGIVEQHDFVIEYIEESKDFAPYKTENPTCLRLIATKL